jgi:VIT1/CCC1 family predicted Fe2+/Mn2+ transporter
MEILIPAIFLGLIPAFSAKSKGRSFLKWWIYGVLLFIVALIHSIVIKSTVGLKNE